MSISREDLLQDYVDFSYVANAPSQCSSLLLVAQKI